MVAGWRVWCFVRMIFAEEPGWMVVNKEVEEGAESATELLPGKM